MTNLEGKKWYAVSTITGHEAKIKAYLEHEILLAHLEDKIGSIFIPTEKIFEIKDKKKKTKTKNLTPGYLYIEAEMDEKVKHFIMNTPSIKTFVGTKGKPVPLLPSEVKRIIGKASVSGSEEEEILKVEVPFQIGEAVKVTSGPFNNFSGFVQEINEEKMKVKVMVSIFGRKTPIELDFSQVEIEK